MVIAEKRISIVGILLDPRLWKLVVSFGVIKEREIKKVKLLIV